MNVIVRRAIFYYIDKYPKARTALLTWYSEFSKFKFSSFNELKLIYANASVVSNNRVVFNIKGNDFRLVVKVNFKQQAAYIIWFGSHTAYDKIAVESVEFDTHILNYKVK